MIRSQTGAPVHWAVASARVIVVPLASYDKGREAPGEDVEPSEVDVPAVHDIDSARLQWQLVQGRYIGRFSVRDMHETGNRTAQVQQRVQFHRTLVPPEVRPREKRQAEVDRSGVEDIGDLFERDAEFLSCVHSPCRADQDMGEIGVDAPISGLVCIGQGRPGHRPADSRMVKLRMKTPQARHDIPEAFSISQLGKGHAIELIEAEKSAESVISTVAPHAGPKSVQWQEIHQLGKHYAPCIHRPSTSPSHRMVHDRTGAQR